MRTIGDIEWTLGLFPGLAGDFAVSLFIVKDTLNVDDGQDDSRRWIGQLHGMVIDDYEPCAQDFVPTDDFAKRTLQSAGIDSAQPQRDRDIVRRTVRLKLVREP